MRFSVAAVSTVSAVLLSLSAGGCSAESDATATADGPIKIGFITKFPGDFYDTMVRAAREYDAQHDDVEVTFRQGRSGTDDESAISFIDGMIAQKVHAIAITPTSPNVRRTLDKAIEAGIKVVLLDNDIPGWTGKSAVVATDNRAGGRLAGQWIAGHLPAGATIGVLQGRLGNPSLDDRVAGMKEGVGDKVSIVEETPTDCDQTKGFNATKDILANHPTIVAVYSACGPPTTGALEAITAANRLDRITLVGFDASTEEIAAISAGTQAASVAQFPAKMGSIGVETAVKVARGQSVAPTIDTGTEMVTRDNVTDYQP